MKLLLLSNIPRSFESYYRDLRSKIHKEIKKELDLIHYIYIYKGENNKNNIDASFNVIELPFYWNHFYQKIANIFFIFFNNLKIIKKKDFDIIRIEMGCGSIFDYPLFFYPLLFPKKKFYIETSTSSVQKSKLKRIIIDFLLKLVLKPYKNIGVNSVSTQNIFKVPEKKVHYNQVGYPEYTFNIKDFQKLSLVYLGTINNRDIWKTVIGFKIFTLKHPDVIISYDIIGSGNKRYVSILKESLKENNMNEYIHYHGFQPVDFVNDIFKKCNVGIAFVPIVQYYDKVSTTKAIEYLLAGMPIIATRTSFATEMVKAEAGVLCNDTPEDFANAIEEFYNNREKFDSEKIRELYKNFGMSYVIKNIHVPTLRSLL